MKTINMTEFQTGGGGWLSQNSRTLKCAEALCLWCKSHSKKETIPSPNWRGWREATGEGFTLAEVLITLGIIGVVAAMTLPTLIQKQNDKEIVSKLKKNYSILSQALTKSQLEYGFFETWEISTAGGNPEEGGTPANMKNAYNRIKPELKVLKECEDKAGCWHKGRTKNLGGANIDRDSIGIGSGIFTFKMADGTNIGMDDFGSTTIQTWYGVNYNKSSYVFWIDANGDKKPNTIGRDIFAFVLTNKGLVPAGIHSNDYCNPKSTTGYQGSTCTAQVIQKGKIDY